jgi:hypothetical protein
MAAMFELGSTTARRGRPGCYLWRTTHTLHHTHANSMLAPCQATSSMLSWPDTLCKTAAYALSLDSLLKTWRTLQRVWCVRRCYSTCPPSAPTLCSMEDIWRWQRRAALKTDTNIPRMGVY